MAATSKNNGPPNHLIDNKNEHHAHWRIDPIPSDLINKPLDFIFADHNRQRQAALILNLIADGEFDDYGIRCLIEFLEQDFVHHIADEQDDFFPALEHQCQQEDNVDELVERLSEEHKEDETTIVHMATVLNDILDGKKLTQEISRELRSFSEHILRHLALENAVLLPLARVRMDAASLKSVAEAMKARRDR